MTKEEIKTMKELGKKVAKILRALGNSPTAIAKALKAKGIKGRRFQACACPLAKLLEIETGHRLYVDSVACPGRVVSRACSPDAFLLFKMTAPLRKFTIAFDVGQKFPELDVCK